ncbi:hypothetical protein [Xenorhabdus miraniensis]|uniref:Uncharacterized protein n=1 Tax=Xenorhabdus miraniensis TaxID=351674 RepID=A0A2D0JWE2_9GAMM|nr:hypothetical protein [Xenorhabdus miraniensis]PHM50530.1 hypothetical protein Xmir_00713 [Xenorhabdus miraniensis]
MSKIQVVENANEILEYYLMPYILHFVYLAQLQSGDLSGLKRNQQLFGDARCTPEEYNKVVETFTRNPEPPGKVMKWVCRNNWDYLDLKTYPLELTPNRS